QCVARRMPGFLQISIETQPKYAPAYVGKFLSAMDRLRTGPIDEKRFNEAKSLVLQEFVKSLADPEARIREILTSELYGVGLGFIPTFPLRLERVTPEVFQRAVSEQFPDKSYVAVIVSPGADMDSRLGQFGRVEVLN
ncbi:MAG: hypothetical protein P8Y94_03635, partial [Acidobacteriota bacterium]